MAEFTDESLEWLDMDMTEPPFVPADQRDGIPWTNTAPNQTFSWETTLAEEAATMTRFLQRLVNEVDKNKKALAAQQEIIESQVKKLKVLDRVTDYLQELEAHLDKLRDMFKEVMPKIHPEWDLKSPALTMFDEAEAETETLVNEYLEAQRV